MKTQIIRSSFLLSFALAACGGSVGGEGAPVTNKSEAAQSAYRTQQTGEGLQSRQGQGLTAAQVTDIPGITDDGVNASTEWTVEGTEGSAKVFLQADVSGGDVQAHYIIEYSSYSSDGIDYIDGRIEYISSVSTGVDVSVQHEVKGDAVIWGTQSAVLDIDTTISVEVSGATGASIQMNGTVVADGETFTYDGEAFDVTVDTF